MSQTKRYYVRQVGEWFKVRAASTANVTVASTDAGQSLDGVTLAEGDYILLKNQTTASQNGIYKVNADTVAPTRVAPDGVSYKAGFNSSGTVVKVTEGSTQARTAWLQYAEPGVVGTDGLLYIDHPTEV